MCQEVKELRRRNREQGAGQMRGGLRGLWCFWGNLARSLASLESILATLSYCSSTSPSFLAVRVLGRRSTLRSTFPFYDWLVLTCPWLYNSLRDLSFLKTLRLASMLSVTDSLTYGIPARLGLRWSRRPYFFICPCHKLTFRAYRLLL